MLRLSNHFLLLDFLYDQSTIDCVVHCGDKLLERVSSIKDDQEVLVEGRHLCETILEPIVKQHGPISIAAGLWFRDLPGQGKAHDTGLAPHEWKEKTGAAADIVVLVTQSRPDGLPGRPPPRARPRPAPEAPAAVPRRAMVAA